jgi:DNA-binding FadR family transcriptional regulator
VAEKIVDTEKDGSSAEHGSKAEDVRKDEFDARIQNYLNILFRWLRQPGARRLPTEDALSTEMDIARSSLREIEGYFMGRGVLVKLKGQKGRELLPEFFDPPYVDELFIIRVALESARAKDLAVLESKADVLDKLEETETKMTKVLDGLDKGSVLVGLKGAADYLKEKAEPFWDAAEDFWKLDTEWHATLCVGSPEYECRPARWVIENNRLHVRVAYIVPKHEPMEAMRQTVLDHQRIREAMAECRGSDDKRGIDKVEQTVRDHLRDSVERVKSRPAVHF